MTPNQLSFSLAMLDTLSEDSIPCSQISRSNVVPTEESLSHMSRVRLLLIQLSGLVVHSSLVKIVIFTCFPAFATDPENKSKTTPQLTSKVDGFVPAVLEVCLPLIFWTGWRSNTSI